MSRRIGARSGTQQRPFRCAHRVQGAPVSVRTSGPRCARFDSGPEVVYLAGIDDAGRRRSVETPASGRHLELRAGGVRARQEGKQGKQSPLPRQAPPAVRWSEKRGICESSPLVATSPVCPPRSRPFLLTAVSPTSRSLPAPSPRRGRHLSTCHSEQARARSCIP